MVLRICRFIGTIRSVRLEHSFLLILQTLSRNPVTREVDVKHRSTRAVIA